MVEGYKDSVASKMCCLKIKMDEFSCDIDFKFGVPLMILDLIHALTGYEIIEDIRKHVIPPKNIEPSLQVEYLFII